MFKINNGAAASLSLLAIVMRVFYGVTIDAATASKSGVLAVLIGGLLAFPVAFAAQQMRLRFASSFIKPIGAILAITALIDAAIVASEIAHSAGYASLERRSKLYLLAPLFALCFWCLTLNGNALGSAARIWNKLLTALLLIVVLLELREYRPAWLFPILGSGIPDLLTAGIRVAGWLSLPVGLYLLAEPGHEQSQTRFSPVRTLLLCTAIAAFLVLLREMMTPPQFSAAASSQTFRLDTLLSNGRAPLSLQLPMLAMWFVGLFFLLLFDTFLCSVMLQRLFPALKLIPCLLLALAGNAALSLSGLLTQSAILTFCNWLFPIQGTALLAAAGAAYFVYGGKANA